jgi:CSLREA domain-containing protein
MKFLTTALMVILAAGIWSLPGLVQATTFTVNTLDDTPDANVSDNICADALGSCSIRAAIEQSNANGDTSNIIEIPGPGFYTLTINTPLTVTKNLTINGVGAVDIVILGDFINRTSRIFTLNGSAAPGGIIDVSISGVTIQNGFADGAHGGGIYLQSANLILSSSIVSTNTAASVLGTGGHGGGIYVDMNSTASLIGVNLIYGAATVNGGAIYNDGILDISNGFIDSNVALNGGGIYQTANGLTQIDTTTISANTALVGTGLIGGGGIHNLGSLFIQRSLLAYNVSDADGGGIYNNGVLDATNVTFSGNSADVATGLGGALRNLHAVVDPVLGPEVILQFVTMNLNTASAGGGINNSGVVGLQSTILAGSTGGNCGGTAVTSLGSNLDSANTCGLTNTGDLINTNPFLQILADNGGPTWTHALSPGSPAINSGIFDPSVDMDQRLQPRPFALNSPMDIGAFEYQGEANVDLVVTKTDQPDPVLAMANLTYTITVTNNGPFVAHGVILTDTLDSTVNFVSVDQMFCSHFAGIITCSIPLLTAGQIVTITVVVTPNVAIPVSNEISVLSAPFETETTPGDNTANTTTVVNNPVPVLTSLDPSSTREGGPIFNLTVTGSNFGSGAVVNWNGAALNTFPDSNNPSTRLTAEVPAANIASPGIAMITVSNPAPGGGLSGSLNFQILYVTNLPVIFKN